ncbi:hypothetical protein LTR56_002106 [Elasticomyces elasticus]|nr:hypothetical protein LTR22_012248 [Elasticomyces elasticus]KAK3658249.1 hypothetical protein LTR56_002106 [Elasticomyces elasticus]KAK4919528.1 hypothetical protein LTR49_012906 [Elasticomyces elasticus]KAK5764134.1 hypothetical protein LTS12_005828 [Elasticomyces elasticus]
MNVIKLCRGWVYMRALRWYERPDSRDIEQRAFPAIIAVIPPRSKYPRRTFIVLRYAWSLALASSLLPLPSLCIQKQSRYAPTVIMFEAGEAKGHLWTAGRIARALPTHRINLRIGLRQGRFDELERTLYEVSTPGHPRYGQHLSQADIHDFIKPSESALAAVKHWLSDYGVHHAIFTQAQDWLSVSLPVEEVERMLDTEYHVYTHEDGGRLLRALRWSLPQHLHEYIDTIQPTNSFFRPMRRSKLPLYGESNPVEGSTTQAPFTPGASVAAVCNSTLLVTPDCLRTLYGTIDYEVQSAGPNFMALNDFLGEVNISASAQSTPELTYISRLAQTLTVLRALFRSDAEMYLQHYRPEAAAAAYEFSQISINGGTLAQRLTPNDTAAGVGIEGNLDAQTMMGIAWPVPLEAYSTGGVNPTYIPDAFTTTDSDEPYIRWLQYVLDLPDGALPSVISTSYDDDEQTIPLSYASRACQMFAQLGARGVTLLFGSGDEGVGPDGYCYSNNGTNGTTFLPEFPSSCPYVTSVGATAHFNPEVAVYDGGGFSNLFPRPWYQNTSVPQYLQKYIGSRHAGLYNPAGRAIPDLAAQGSNFTIYWNGSLTPVSGTSASTPLMAAILALVNDALIAAGKPKLGFLNPWLYSVGHEAFTDILSGSSAGCNTDGFPAEPGWDAVTGWGTPRFHDILSLLGVENATATLIQYIRAPDDHQEQQFLSSDNVESRNVASSSRAEVTSPPPLLKRKHISEALVEDSDEEEESDAYSFEQDTSEGGSGAAVKKRSVARPNGVTASSRAGKKQKQSPPLRRPAAVDEYYSNKCTEDSWGSLEDKRKLDLTHVGRIEETEVGVNASQACERCHTKERTCRIYHEKARASYHVGDVGYSCAHCRFDCKPCSFSAMHKKPANKTKDTLKVENEAMKNDIALLKKHNRVLEKKNAELSALVADYERREGEFGGFDD